MSSEALLALLGAAVAVYALLPTERRLDLRLQLSGIDWSIIVGAILLVHYIKFYPVFATTGLAPMLGPWRFGFDADIASYGIVATAVVGVSLHARFRKLPPSSLQTFHELTETLLQNGKYAELGFLLERHFDALFEISADDTSWRFRLLRTLNPRPIPPIVTMKDGEVEVVYRPPRTGVAAKIAKALAAPLERAPKRREEALDVLQLILKHEGFAEALAATRPALALAILSRKARDRFGFQDVFIAALLRNTRSQLYSELRNNQNLRSLHRYAILPANRILSFYLTNPRVGEELAIYKPIGDFALAEVRRRRRLGSAEDEYLREVDQFDTDGAWRCPIYATIRFFDIMILESIHAKIDWHMWLYYLPLIVREMAANVQRRSDVDESREWPTPYHYLIYEAISSMRSWIEESADIAVDTGQPIVLDESARLENGSIPKSATIAIGQALAAVLTSPEFTGRYKGALLEMALYRHKQMVSNALTASLARSLTNAVAAGGTIEFPKSGYRDELVEAFRHVDLIRRFELRDDVALKEIIKEAETTP